MTQLPLILVLPATAPAESLSSCVKSHTVKIPACNVQHWFSQEVFWVETVNSFAFTASLVP